jgi:hypothetical protein
VHSCDYSSLNEPFALEICNSDKERHGRVFRVPIPRGIAGYHALLSI